MNGQRGGNLAEDTVDLSDVVVGQKDSLYFPPLYMRMYKSLASYIHAEEDNQDGKEDGVNGS
jgi:hypothetical protein